MNSKRVLISLFLWGCVATRSVLAVDSNGLCNWTGTTTAWTTAANWSGAGCYDGVTRYVPSSGDSINFGATANAQNLTLTTGPTVVAITFTSGYTGTFNFGSYTLTITGNWADFSSGGTITAATGTLAFTAGSGTQAFKPKSGGTMPTLNKSGAGTVTVTTTALTAGALTMSNGVWDWGVSTLTHAVTSIATSGASTMIFGTNTVQVTSGDANFTGLGTLTSNTGTLTFTAASGTQIFSPVSGGTHPNISHTGAGTLQLANHLTCLSFSQSEGIFDFNRQNITTTSGGNFTISNGVSTSIVGIGGRTLTVAGNTTLNGKVNNLLNLNPSSAWTIAVTGTLTSDRASIENSTASVSVGTATNCVNEGTNSGWTFSSTTYYWNENDVLASTNARRTYNYTSNADGTGTRPPSPADDEFNSISLGSAWTVRDSDNDGTTGANDLTTNAGQLTLSGRGADVLAATNEFYALYRTDMTEAVWDITVKVISVNGGDADKGRAGIMIADNFTTLSSGGFCYIAFQRNGKVEFNTDIAGNIGEIEASDESVGSMSGPVWLRLVKNTTTISGFFRTSLSSAWTQLGSARTIQSMATASQVGLMVSARTAATTVTGVFDDFQAAGPLLTEMNLGLSFAGTGANADVNATMSDSLWVGSIDFTGYTGTFNFGAQRLIVNRGNVTFVAGQTITQGTGTIEFTAADGTQILTPKSGATHPSIFHSGAGTLQLATNALICNSLTQTAGAFDFNSLNVTTASNGNVLMNGGTLSNLGGRTITVNGTGTTTFGGQNGNLLGLNPSSGWTLAAGSGTVTADYANIKNSTVTGVTGTATNCTNGGSNSGWSFTTSDNYLTNWAYKKNIVFNTTSANGGANVTTNLANFPILLRLTNANFPFGQARDSGTDIRFTDPDGTHLAYQIERWDKANQLAEVWVRIPQIDASSATDFITMYWGNSSAGDSSSGSNVFRVADGFEAAWHLHNSSFNDATSNANTVTNYGSADATGDIASGRSLDGNDSISAGTGPSLSGTGDATLSAWIKTSSSSISMILCQRDVSAFNGQYLFQMNANGTINWEISNAGAQFNFASTGTVNNNAWHHVMVTRSSTNGYIYIDGVQDGTASGTLKSFVSTLRTYIGANRRDANYYFTGSLDEIRILTGVARSADWAKMEYATQKAAATCVFYGAPYPDWAYNTNIAFNTTSSGANTSTAVTNFPLLVRLDSSNFIFSQAKSAGEDIRFADADGTVIPYSIERWDNTAKKAWMWVRVPQVDANSMNDYIKMFWGRPDAVDQSSASSVFSAYKAVYHLAESPGASAPQFVDASGLSNSGTAQAGATGDSVTTNLGKGYLLNGSSKYISTTTSYSNPGTFTISAWCKSTTTSGGIIVSFGSKTGSSADYDRNIYMGNNGKINFGVNPGAINLLTSASAYNNGEWHLVTGRLSSAGQFLYVDGVQVGSDVAMTTGQNFVGYWRGGYDNLDFWPNLPTSYFFNGTLDEIQVTHTELSADYIKLTYETQKTNSPAVVYSNTALSNWAYNTRIYVNTAVTGANTTTNVTNYPMLVRLNASNFNFSQAKDYGEDLRFTKSDGTLLSYEIERFDATNKVAEVWVRLDTVYSNNNSQYFKMFWGKSSASSLSSGKATFSAATGFLANWHLAEEGGTTSGAYKDATSYANHGTGTAMTTSSDTDAVVGRGQNFNGSTQYITAPYSSFIGSTTSSFTVSAWFKPDVVTAVRRLFSQSAFTSTNGWGFGNDAATPELSTWGVKEYNPTYTLSASTWYHMTIVIDAAFDANLYINGVYIGQSLHTVGATANTDDILIIGAARNLGAAYSEYFDGIIDELTISNTIQSADRIKLNYETQKTNANAVTVGYRTGDFAKSTILQFNTTSSGANVSTSVTNIPILVSLTSSNFDFTQVRDDGKDLLFLDPDGGRLYHEIVQWDKANKLGKVWVKVPQVDGNALTDYITAYYGCSSCTGNPQERPDSLWVDFKSVFHLEGTKDKAYDAAALANHGTYYKNMPNISGITTTTALAFDGTSDYVSLPTESNYDILTNLSVSTWIKVNAFNIASQAIVNKGDVSWKITRSASSNTIVFTCTKTSTGYSATGAVNVNDGGWHLITGTYDGSNVKLYVDGVQDGSSTALTGSIDNTASVVYIGENSGSSGKYFNGEISDVRIGNTTGPLNADYIKLSYQNQKANSLLFSSITTSSFTSSKIYKFNTTSTGANVSGDVYNYPLLIRITGSTIIDAVQSGAPDIRFLDGDGVTWLPYQIERWDQSADLAEVWVLIPEVDGNSNGDFITMYYNDVTNGSVTDGQCKTCVFSTGNKFAGVWHLDEETAGTGTASVYKDATGNAYHGSDMISATDQTGIIGKGHDFDGTDDRIDLVAGSSFISSTTSPFTTSVWFKADAIPTSSLNARMFTMMSVDTNTTMFSMGIGDTNNFQYLTAGIGTNQSSYTVLATGNWYQGVVTYDGTTFKSYVNGALDSAKVSVGAAGTTSIARAGIRTGSNLQPFNGLMDELRVSLTARSADWIKLDYQSQRASPTLFNPSTADFIYSKKYTFNTTKTGANVMDSVTNFPLLVRVTGSTIVDAIRSDYKDLRFLDGDGKTWLNYQVERFTQGATDSAIIWVLVPQVDGNSATDFITLYYGEASSGLVADGQCATCVFATSNGFTGVWHLDEETAGINNAEVYQDATSNNYDGDDMVGSTLQTGYIGKGHDLDGTDDRIDLVSGNALLPTASTPFTASLWFLADVISTAGANNRVFNIPALDSGSNFYLSVGDTNNFMFIKTAGGAQHPSTKVLTTGTWYYAALTSDGTTQRTYLNGALDTSFTGNPGAGTAALARIGWKNSTEGKAFNGLIDEVRWAQTTRSADWIKLEYQSQLYTNNVFWNSRSGPNNKATLTASQASNGINLSWNSSVSDSSNADSIGIWVKYQAVGTTFSKTYYPDSAKSAATRVVILPVSDTTYSYPATYPNVYYFGLAVRNSSGVWSPMTTTSSDTTTIYQNLGGPDTIYVDSAIGLSANSCASARNPATPKRYLGDAIACESNAIDSLVIRIMPGVYTDSTFDSNTKPDVLSSFDFNSRAILGGSGSKVEDGATQNFTTFLWNDITFRNLDIRCATNNNVGIYLTNEDNMKIEGCRIYNNGSAIHSIGITSTVTTSENIHIANNTIYQTSSHGMYLATDSKTNIVNNNFIGTGVSGARGLYLWKPNSVADLTVTNNIFYNWDYGIQSVSSSIGTCSNNLFYLVSSGRELTGINDANKVLKDPLFANTNISDKNAFKLLPTSPAIDAGTSTYGGGQNYGSTLRSFTDPWGTSRPQGAAMDIGAYEGSGYTNATSGEFDTLITAITATTVTVRNSKWKIVFDQSRGGGIRYLYNMTDSTSNLIPTDSLLLNTIVGSTNVSQQTGNTIAPELVRRTRVFAYVKQRVAISVNMDLELYYTIHASGHIYVESRAINLTTSSLAMSALSYTARVGTATGVYSSGGLTSGFGYLNTASRDVGLMTTLPLDTGTSNSTEVWTQTSASGSNGYVLWSTQDLGDISGNHWRTHSFLIYIGDLSLTYSKTAALYSQASTPQPLKVYSGSPIHERSWQDELRGHWTFDDATGSTARDRAVYFQHNGTITGGTWATGMRGGALSLATTDVVSVADNDSIEASFHWSIAFWVNPDFTNMGTTAYFLSKWSVGTNGYHIRKISGQNQITFTMGTGTATVTLNNGAWNHVCFTVSSRGQIYAYVNGIMMTASTTNASASTNANALRFGENTGGGAVDKFKGVLDDLRLFRRELDPEEIQSLITQGFSRLDGMYRLRADNNNRIDVVLNDSLAQTNVQPTFYIDNWYAGKTPNFVYLNGVKLTPLTDFVSDTLLKNFPNGGAKFIIQLNKTITTSKAVLFIDDDDSTGYLGAISRMPYLTSAYNSTTKKITVKNFADTVFGAYGSNQWELTIDLLGSTDTADGDGGIYSWKSSEISPGLSISMATDLTGAGQYTLDQMRLDNTGVTEYLSGIHYTSPATNTTYTLQDSSSTRLKIKINAVTMNVGTPDFVVERTFTIYPTGKIFISNKWTSLSADATNVELVYPALYHVDSDVTTVGYAAATGKAGKIGGAGDLDIHSIGLAALSVKPGAGAVVMGGSTVSSTDHSSTKMGLVMNNYYTNTNVTAAGVYTNYLVDISRDFADSASLDTALTSEFNTTQLMTAITGSLVTNDGLDFNSDGFAEGEGAYTYAASSGGIAHFQFNAAVPRVKPTFKITSWTFGTTPDYVIVDNQSLIPGYHYNVHLDGPNNAVIIQLNQTLSGGTHVCYFSHKNGLAVSLNTLYAQNEKGGNILGWVTESEFENLGYHIWRRNIPLPDTATPLVDSLHNPAELVLTAEELNLQGYARVTQKLIPGAPDGRSNSTRNYRQLDKSAAFGSSYEYLLETMDFQGKSVFYGPVKATPANDLETALLGNFPNPFNPVTFIRFALRDPVNVSLVIYDARGRVVKTLIRPDKIMKAGRYSITWNAITDRGEIAATAPYFYRFQAGKFLKTKKMILLK